MKKATSPEIKDFAEKCARLDDLNLATLYAMATALEMRQNIAEAQKKNTA